MSNPVQLMSRNELTAICVLTIALCAGSPITLSAQTGQPSRVSIPQSLQSILGVGEDIRIVDSKWRAPAVLLEPKGRLETSQEFGDRVRRSVPRPTVTAFSIPLDMPECADEGRRVRIGFACSYSDYDADKEQLTLHLCTSTPQAFVQAGPELRQGVYEARVNGELAVDSSFRKYVFEGTQSLRECRAQVDLPIRLARDLEGSLGLVMLLFPQPQIAFAGEAPRQVPARPVVESASAWALVIDRRTGVTLGYWKVWGRPERSSQTVVSAYEEPLDQLPVLPETSGRPRFPDIARSLGEGTYVVVAKYRIDSDGRVEIASLRVLETPDPVFTQAVRSFLPRARYVPAMRDGAAVAVTVTQRFVFSN